MGFGNRFMEFAQGWNRYVSGFGHKVAGGAKYYWNGGDNPSVDDSECMIGRIEGGQEYYYGSDLMDAGKQGMGSGISGMWDSIVDPEPSPDPSPVPTDGAGGGMPSSGGASAGAGGGLLNDTNGSE